MRSNSRGSFVLGVLAVALVLGGSSSDASGATVVYNLYATDGYVEMPDGLPVYVYGFVGGREGVDLTYQTSYCIGDGTIRTCNYPNPGPGGPNVTLPGGPPAPVAGPPSGQEIQLAGNAQFPGPLLHAAVGDTIEIRLKNLGSAAQPNNLGFDPCSLHFHGLDMPENTVAAAVGDVVTYTLTPTRAGTYLYSSSGAVVDEQSDIQVNMGMFGVLVVYNPEDPARVVGPGRGFGGTLYGVPYDRDVVLLVSEFDIRGHADEEGTYVPGGLLPPNTWDPDPFSWAEYRPRYWHINGLSFPNTAHADFMSTYSFAEWLAAHPNYDPLITGSVSYPSPVWGTPGEKVLIRLVNAGYQLHSMHLHGYHGKVLGADQRAWDWGFAPMSKINKPGVRPFGEGLEKSLLAVAPGETYDWLIDLGRTPGLPGQSFLLHDGDLCKSTNDGVYPGGMRTSVVPTP